MKWCGRRTVYTMTGSAICCPCRQEQVYSEAGGHFAAMLFLQRMRTTDDRAFISQVFRDVWDMPLPDLNKQAVAVTPERLTIGMACLMRSSRGDHPASYGQST